MRPDLTARSGQPDPLDPHHDAIALHRFVEVGAGDIEIAAGRLERYLLAEWFGAGDVWIYDATQPPSGRRPVRIASPRGDCVSPKPGWQNAPSAR